MTRDVLLVTVDCWRADAPEHMPRLRDLAAEWPRGDAICAGAATNGVFPALLASSDAPAAYDTEGSLRDDVVGLSDVFRDNGYETAGFVASNPFLGKWSKRFDTFWNDGMGADGVEANRDEYTFFDKLRSLGRLQSRVTAPEVLQRASQWWEQTDGPRFCWVHLMEPHGPYYPGLQRGLSLGLLRSYLSIVGYSMRGKAVPDWMHRQLRQLHDSCVTLLDEHLSAWLSTFDSPLVVLTGDHGEEFDHGLYGHSRLYDETVRVPLFANDDGIVSSGELVRQVDIAPRICRTLGLNCPDEWQGNVDGEDSLQCMLSKTKEHDRIYAGVRSDSQKLIREFDWDGTLLDTETYDLEADPKERDPNVSVDDELAERLDQFLSRDDVRASLGHGKQTGMDGDVSERLRELGYVE